MSSRESAEQGKSGRRGAEAPGNEGSGGQPRQGSQRVETRSDEEPKHSFMPGQAPSRQGDGDPGPERIVQNQQGLAGSGTGRQGSHGGGDRSEERAQQGSPGEEHTRHGRQSAPGDRD